MKKILLLVVVISTSFLATAQQGPLVISATGLKGLELGENMKVTLVSSGRYRAERKEATAFFEKLNVSVHNGTMKIDGRNRLYKNDSVLVVVDALESLTLRQNTQVNTEGTLHGKHLNVYVETGAVASLLTTQKVNGFSLDDTDVTIYHQPARLMMHPKVK